MTVHRNREISVHVRAALVPLIDRWQNAHPNRLLSTALVTSRATEALDVSGVVVRRHLTNAVADGDLTEILVRRDWVVALPYDGQLYAVPDGQLYKLSRKRPASQGSNGISFLTTPTGYITFLRNAMKEFPPGRKKR